MFRGWGPRNTHQDKSAASFRPAGLLSGAAQGLCPKTAKVLFTSLHQREARQQRGKKKTAAVACNTRGEQKKGRKGMGTREARQHEPGRSLSVRVCVFEGTLEEHFGEALGGIWAPWIVATI